MEEDQKDQGQEPDTKEFDDAFDEIAKGETPPDKEGRDDPPPKEEGDDEQGQSDGADDDQSGEPDNPPPAEGADTQADDDQQGRQDGEGEGEEAGTTDDLWANATPEQKAAYEAAERRAKELDHRIKSDDGRVATYQRQVNELQAEIRRLSANKTGADSKDEGTEDLDKELAEVAEEYPEVAQPFLKVINKLSGQLQEVTQHQQRQVEQQTAQQLDQNYSRLVEAHPDFTEYAASGEFQEWVHSQPKYIQDAAYRNAENIIDADEAIALVQQFKQSRETAQDPNPEPASQGQDKSNLAAKRQKQLESGASVPSKGPGAASGPPEDFESAFEYFAKSG